MCSGFDALGQTKSPCTKPYDPVRTMIYPGHHGVDPSKTATLQLATINFSICGILLPTRMRYTYVVGFLLSETNVCANSTLSEVDRTHAMALHSPARENIYLQKYFHVQTRFTFYLKNILFRPFGLVSRNTYSETEDVILSHQQFPLVRRPGASPEYYGSLKTSMVLQN